MLMENPQEYMASSPFESVQSGVLRLTLTKFRSYEHLRLETDLSPVVLTGDNGAGKTNILEALSFLTPGRGLRRAKLADISTKKSLQDEISSFSQGLIPISSNSSNWAVSANVLSQGEEISLGTGTQTSIKIEDGENTKSEKRVVKINGEKVKNQSELGKYLTSVWLTPSMDRLFRGAPAPRRRFLDRLVYAFNPEHGKKTSAYEYNLRQWNKLIKEGRRDNFWFNAIEESLAQDAVAIAAMRREFSQKLSYVLENSVGAFPRGYFSIEGAVESWLDEMSAIDAEDRLKEAYKKQRKELFFEGYVSPEGPHKTDIKVVHKDKNMPAELCSTGEQKALLISIILAQASLQKKENGQAPILLLDEIAAHLDDKRREALFEEIYYMRAQAWLTGTDEKIFESLRNKAQIIKIKDSQIVSCD